MHGGIKMKRFLTACFMILFAGPAIAENYVIFKSDVVEKAINQLVASENRQSAADEYQTNMDQESGKISVTGLYKVCIASGFDIQTNDGYIMCRTFLNFMISETENMGMGIASQKNCASQFNGVWTISSDGTQYQCIGRDGYELVYNQSCNGEEGECIKQFSGLQTQGSNGREFINAYGQLHGLNLTCHSVIETRRTIASPLGQDYIKCSAGGKSYEFEFDDLNQTLGEQSSRSENTAICELYGGTIIDTGDKNTEEVWQSCNVSSDTCNGAITDLARRTGHTVQYQGYCRLSRDVETVAVAHLNQIEGIDSFVFYNAGAQTRMDTAKPMVEEYLRTQFPTATSIICDSNPKRFEGAGLRVDIDYVMSCRIDSQQIDFVFDELSVSSNMAADAGIDAMQCIINGGNYDGKFCRWLNEDECNALNDEEQDVARWDTKAGACVMKDSAKYNTFKNGVRAIGGTVVAVAVTVATGGGAVVVFAIVATDAMFEGAFAVFQRLQETNPQHRAVQFIKETQDCHNSACASAAITNHFVRLDEIMIDLSTDMQNVIMDHFEYLSSLLTEEEFDEAMNASDLTIGDRAYNATGVTLMLAALFVNPDQAIVKGMARAPKLASRLGRYADKFLSNASKFKLMNLVKTAPDGKNVYKMVNLETGYATYLKYTDMDELNYTLKASRFKPSSNKPILHIVSVNTTNQTELANVVKVNNLQPKRADQVYLMTDAVPEGTTPFLLSEGHDIHFLNGKSITKSEADQLLREIGEMNAAGIYHGDINSNILISRDAAGDLQAYVIDFEPWSREGHIDDVADIRDVLYKVVSQEADNVSGTRLQRILGRAAEFRSGSTNSLGQDYYRIFINNDAEAPGILQKLQNNGFYVSANSTSDGRKFLAVSEKNIFGRWDNAPTNWLRFKNSTKTVSKTAKISQARAANNLGYHGTDADISLNDMIRPSANTSGRLGSVGYGIARDYKSAERYAVKRLIERQNPGVSINFELINDTLVVRSSNRLNLNNKIGYVYTTAKNSNIKWDSLYNNYVGRFDAAKMPESVEILDKSVFNLDDLIRQGSVKIIQP